MLLEHMNWMDVEEYLKKDDRLVLVTGSTEQHGYYSVATDTQCPWETAKAACEIEQVILAPALPYGVSPGWMAYPGTVSLDPRTYLDVIDQILRSFVSHGFKRIIILNAHGGNTFAAKIIGVVREDHPDVMIKYCGWIGPKATKFLEKEGASSYQHASWVEGFSWINQVGPLPSGEKPPVGFLTEHREYHFGRTPQENRERLGDGMAGGFYSKDEKTMREYFQATVDDLLDALRGEWV